MHKLQLSFFFKYLHSQIQSGNHVPVNETTFAAALDGVKLLTNTDEFLERHKSVLGHAEKWLNSKHPTAVNNNMELWMYNMLIKMEGKLDSLLQTADSNHAATMGEFAASKTRDENIVSAMSRLWLSIYYYCDCLIIRGMAPRH